MQKERARWVAAGRAQLQKQLDEAEAKYDQKLAAKLGEAEERYNQQLATVKGEHSKAQQAQDKLGANTAKHAKEQTAKLAELRKANETLEKANEALEKQLAETTAERDEASRNFVAARAASAKQRSELDAEDLQRRRTLSKYEVWWRNLEHHAWYSSAPDVAFWNQLDFYGRRSFLQTGL